MRLAKMPAEKYVTSFGIRNQLYIFIQTTGQRSPALRQALNVVRKLSPMIEHLLIKGGADFLGIAITRRPYPDGDNPYDLNWLNATIRVRFGAFSGSFDAYLLTWDFELMLEGFKHLYTDLNHSFSYKALEEQINFTVKGDGIGHIGLDGQVMDQAGIGNELSFEMSLDQSYLPDIIRQLEELLQVYPPKE